MRILFVDDEDMVLAGLERTMFMADREWELDFANSGAKALEKMQTCPADVVVSDMRMPMMDGAQLMRRVRDEWPSAIRIILSGHTEQEAALRCLDVAQQFLSKPCDGAAIVETIDRTVALQQMLHDKTVLDVIGRIDRLPAEPRIYARLNLLLADGDVRIDAVAATVKSDPALAAKVLQVANCAFFAGPLVTNIAAAVDRVGFNLLRQVVLASEVFSVGDPVRLDLLRRRAVRASRLAGEIGAPYAPKETVMIAALLAEVGQLIPEVDALCRDADTERCGFPSPAEVGAYLLGTWGLPAAIVEAVAHHRNPRRVQHRGFDALGVVHVATALATGEAPDERYLREMGVTDRLAAWRDADLRLAEQEDFP